MRSRTVAIVGVAALTLAGLSGAVVLGQGGGSQRIVHAKVEPGKGFYFTREQVMQDVKMLTDGKRSQSLTVLQGGHYSINIVHRRGDERPQWHKEDTDFYIIQEGTATIITGGELVGPFDEASDGDMRGTAIKGGVSRVVKPGDLVFIPPGVPHQGVFDDPEGVTYINVHWPGNWRGPWPPEAN